MRYPTLTLGILAVAPLVLAHGHVVQHPARHLDSKRSAYRHEEGVRRASPASDDDGEDAGNSGILGILGGSSTAEDSTASITASTRLLTPVVASSTTPSSAIASTSATARSAVTGPSSEVIPGSSIAYITGSASIINPTNGLNASAMINPSGTLGTNHTSSSITSAATSPTSSQAPSSSGGSGAVAYTTITTDASGQESVITLVLTQTASSSGASAAAASDPSSSGDSISKGAIVGISVAVGLVVLGLVGCAIWRMKRRSGDEDEVIRWPELNRHGDSSVHHALPARQTGQHGFDTNPLSRTLSNSSSIFSPSTIAPPHSATPMALNGSSFGAASSLEEYDPNAEMYDEKDQPPVPALPPLHGSGIGLGAPPSYGNEDDYTNLPPAVQISRIPTGSGIYDSGSDEEHGHTSGRPEMNMAGIGKGGVTF